MPRYITHSLTSLALFVAILIGMPPAAQAQSLVGNKSFCVENINGQCGPVTGAATIGDMGRYTFTVDNGYGADVPNFVVTEAFDPRFHPFGQTPISCTDPNGQAIPNLSVAFAGSGNAGPATLTFNPLPAATLVTCTMTGVFSAAGIDIPNLVHGPAGDSDHNNGDEDITVQQGILNVDLALDKQLLSAPTLDILGGAQTATYQITLTTDQTTPIGPHISIFDQLGLAPTSQAINALLGAYTCNHVDASGTVLQSGVCAIGQNFGTPLTVQNPWDNFVQFVFGTSFILQPTEQVVLTFDVAFSSPATSTCVVTDPQTVHNSAFLALADGVTALNDQDNSNNTDGRATPIPQALTTGLTVDPNCSGGGGGGGNGGPPPPSPLEVTKTPVNGSGTYGWGGAITYEITFTNTDPTFPVWGISGRDVYHNLPFTPNHDLQLIASSFSTCPAGSTCTITAPTGGVGPVQQIQGYQDQKDLLFFEIDRLDAGASATLTLTIELDNPFCDSAGLYPNKSVRNTVIAPHTYGDPDDLDAQYQRAASAWTDVQMEPLPLCQTEVTKQASTLGPIVFGQPSVYTLTYSNTGSDPESFGTVMDALRLAQPNYSVGTTVDYAFACTDGGTGVTGYQPSGSGSGTVTYTAQANQGLQIMDHAGFVTFGPASTLTCEVEIIVHRPATTDPYCFSSTDTVPLLENTAVLEQALFYNPSLTFPSGYPSQAHASVETELPRCINIELNKSVDRSFTGPQGPAVNYTIAIDNLSQSGSDGALDFTASGDGIAITDLFDLSGGQSAPSLTLTGDPCTTPATCTWISQPDALTVHQIGAGQTLNVTYSAAPNPEFSPHELCNDVSGAFEINGAPFDSDAWYVQRDMEDDACIYIRNFVEITKTFDLPAGESLVASGLPVTVDLTCTHTDPAIVQAPTSHQLTAANGWSVRVPVFVGSDCTATEQTPPSGLLPAHCSWDAPTYPLGQTVRTDASQNDWPLEIVNSATCISGPPDVTKTCDAIPANASYPITLDCEITVTGTSYPVPGWVAIGDFFQGIIPPATIANLDVTAMSMTPTPPLLSCQSQIGTDGRVICFLNTADLAAAGGSLTFNASVTFNNPLGLDEARNCAVLGPVQDGPFPGISKSQSSEMNLKSNMGNDTPVHCVPVDLPSPLEDTEGDLSVTKTVVKEDGPYKVFEITPVLTGGPINSPDIHVLEVLPAGMTIEAMSAPDWTCTPNVPPNLSGPAVVDCIYAGSYPVQAGNLGQIYVEVTDKGSKNPNCARIGHVPTDPSASGGFTDLDPSNDQDCADPSGKPDIAIEKTLEPLGNGMGQFTLQPTLTGAPLMSAPLFVTDDVPAGMEVQAAPSSDWDCQPPAVQGPAQMVCEYIRPFPIGTGPLPPIELLAKYEGGVKNCAHVIVEELDPSFEDSDPNNNSDCAETPTEPPVIYKPSTFEIAKGIDPAGASPANGTVFNFTVTGCTYGGTPSPAAFSLNWPADFGSPQGARQLVTVSGATSPTPSCTVTELPPSPTPSGCAWAAPRLMVIGSGLWTDWSRVVPAASAGSAPTVVGVSNRLNCKDKKPGNLSVIKTVTQPDPLIPNQMGAANVTAPPSSVQYPVSVTCSNSAGQTVASFAHTFPAAGGGVSFPGIPAGASCTAVEGPLPAAQNCSWQTSVAPASTVIASGATAQIEVTNTYLCKMEVIQIAVPSRFQVVKQIHPASAPIPNGTAFPISISGCTGGGTPSLTTATYVTGTGFAGGHSAQTITVSGSMSPSTCTVSEDVSSLPAPAGCSWAAPDYSTDGGSTWTGQAASITGAQLLAIGGGLLQVQVRNRLVCAPPPPSISITKTCTPNPLVLAAPAPAELTCTITLSGTNLLPGHPIVITDTITSVSGATTPVITSVPVTNTGSQILNCAAQGAPNVIKCITISDYLIAQGTLSTDITMTVDNAWDTGDLQNCVQGVHQAFGAGSYGSNTACDQIDVIKQTETPELTYAKECLPNPLEVAEPDDPATLRCKITVSGQNLTPGQTITFDENLTAPGYGYAVSVNSVTSLNPAIDCTLVTPAPADMDCMTTTDAIIAAGGTLSGWISIVIENAGMPDAFQNCVGPIQAQGGAKNLPPQTGEACVTIPVVLPSEPDPTPTPDTASFSILKELVSPCDVNRAAQTYTCDFGFDITNTGGAAYRGPLVVGDHFGTGRAPSNVTLTGGKEWSCPSSDAAAATCVKGAGALDAGQTDSFQMQVTLPGLPKGGTFCNTARLGLGDDSSMRTLVVQEAMRLIGVDGGPSDGKAGPQTTRGVEALQERLGLEANGAIDDALLTALGVPLGELASSGEVCAELPPMPAPPVQCNASTTRQISETQCACRYDRMTKSSATSCSCESGLSLVAGKGCVKTPRKCEAGTQRIGGKCVPVRKTCPSGLTLIDGVCIVTGLPDEVTCDARSTVKRRGSCQCRYQDMRKVSASRCVCSNGRAPENGLGCRFD